jgi:hypothetical protein
MFTLSIPACINMRHRPLRNGHWLKHRGTFLAFMRDQTAAAAARGDVVDAALKQMRL